MKIGTGIFDLFTGGFEDNRKLSFRQWLSVKY